MPIIKLLNFVLNKFESSMFSVLVNLRQNVSVLVISIYCDFFSCKKCNLVDVLILFKTGMLSISS